MAEQCGREWTLRILSNYIKADSLDLAIAIENAIRYIKSDNYDPTYDQDEQLNEALKEC